MPPPQIPPAIIAPQRPQRRSTLEILLLSLAPNLATIGLRELFRRTAPEQPLSPREQELLAARQFAQSQLAQIPGTQESTALRTFAETGGGVATAPPEQVITPDLEALAQTAPQRLEVAQQAIQEAELQKLIDNILGAVREKQGADSDEAKAAEVIIDAIRAGVPAGQLGTLRQFIAPTEAEELNDITTGILLQRIREMQDVGEVDLNTLFEQAGENALLAMGIASDPQLSSMFNSFLVAGRAEAAALRREAEAGRRLLRQSAQTFLRGNPELVAAGVTQSEAIVALTIGIDALSESSQEKFVNFTQSIEHARQAARLGLLTSVVQANPVAAVTAEQIGEKLEAGKFGEAGKLYNNFTKMAKELSGMPDVVDAFFPKAVTDMDFGIWDSVVNFLSPGRPAGPDKPVGIELMASPEARAAVSALAASGGDADAAIQATRQFIASIAQIAEASPENAQRLALAQAALRVLEDFKRGKISVPQQ